MHDTGPNLKGPYVSAYRTRHLSCKLTVYLGGALLTARHSDFSGAVRSRGGGREHGAVYRQGLLFITILTLAVIIVDFIILELSSRIGIQTRE